MSSLELLSWARGPILPLTVWLWEIAVMSSRLRFFPKFIEFVNTTQGGLFWIQFLVLRGNTRNQHLTDLHVKLVVQLVVLQFGFFACRTTDAQGAISSFWKVVGLTLAWDPFPAPPGALALDTVQRPPTGCSEGGGGFLWGWNPCWTQIFETWTETLQSQVTSLYTPPPTPCATVGQSSGKCGPRATGQRPQCQGLTSIQAFYWTGPWSSVCLGPVMKRCRDLWRVHSVVPAVLQLEDFSCLSFFSSSLLWRSPGFGFQRDQHALPLRDLSEAQHWAWQCKTWIQSARQQLVFFFSFWRATRRSFSQFHRQIAPVQIWTVSMKYARGGGEVIHVSERVCRSERQTGHTLGATPSNPDRRSRPGSRTWNQGIAGRPLY